MRRAADRQAALRILAAVAVFIFAFSLANFAATDTVLADFAVFQEDSHASGDAHSENATAHEKAEENETEAFKHSASVQYVARKTGLSLENAYWLCVLLNFAVVAGFIIWAWKKTMPGVFRSRTASIQKAMEEARQASQDANRRLGDIEARLARLDGEISQMRGTAEMEMVAEEERIKAAAQEDVKKVVEAAEQEIEAAAKSARRELKAFAADLVVSLAKKQITVDAPTDQALVRGFSSQLSAERDGRQGGR